ncbi:MAG: type II CAAX endopeptidase family protein [Kineosporiaceae bacterium]
MARPGRAWWSRLEVVRFLEAALVRAVPRDHLESDRVFRRRRVVVAVTACLGAVLVGVSFQLAPGDPRFYLTTGALALVWTLGSLVSGPLHLGWAHTRSGSRLVRPVVQSLALGLLAVAVFCAGAVVVARVPVLRDHVNDVLDHARFSLLPVVAVITVVNGVAEELFFRGALYAAIGRRYPVLVSTGLYALTTVASANPMLVFAAAVLGLLVGRQRRVTGGVLGPMVTHATWSLSMLFLLPVLLGALAGTSP